MCQRLLLLHLSYYMPAYSGLLSKGFSFTGHDILGCVVDVAGMHLENSPAAVAIIVEPVLEARRPRSGRTLGRKCAGKLPSGLPVSHVKELPGNAGFYLDQHSPVNYR